MATEASPPVVFGTCGSPLPEILGMKSLAGRVTEHADKLQRLQAGGDTGPGCIISEWSVAIDERSEKES